MANMDAPNIDRVTSIQETPQEASAEQASSQTSNPLAPLITDTDTPMEDSAMDGTDSPQLTDGLEALLGGLGPIPSTVKPIAESSSAGQAMQIEPTVQEVKPAQSNSPNLPAIPGLFSVVQASASGEKSADPVTASRPSSKGSVTMSDAPTVIPGLDALLNNSDNTQPELNSASELQPNPSTETIMTAAPAPSAIPGLSLPTSTEQVASNPSADNRSTPISTLPTEPSKPLPTTAENGTTPVFETSNTANETAPAEDGEIAEEEHPEWEVDSSPIESSSDDSSSDDSSSDEDSDGEDAYKLLSVEEQAKILMEADGSDDEGVTKAKGRGTVVRTAHEVPEVVITKPDVAITANMSIVELGAVEVIVDNIVLVKARTSGEYRVLDSGSVLCLENRSVIGAVSETIGRVQQPMYSVLFTNAQEVTDAGLTVGTQIFYSEAHSTYVFTQALKAFKGSDASNIYDEEVGDEEREFSDDEQEAEFKRARKARINEQKRAQQGNGHENSSAQDRGRRHPLKQENGHYDPTQGISYDDADEDGPYKPLARPAGYANTVGRNEAPQEGAYSAHSGGHQGGHDRRDQNKGQSRGRGDRDRGRGGRGRGDRGRGGRGRGDQGYCDNNRRNAGAPAASHSPAPYQPQGMGFGQSSPPLMSPTNQYNQIPPPPQFPSGFSAFPQMPQMPQLPGMPPWPFPPPPPQVLQNMFQAQQNGWPNMNPGAPSQAGGAFLNPAFFGNINANPQNGAPNPGQWNQQGRGGRGGSGN